MSVYSIKDLEHLSGIKAHTIRIWEQRHKLFTPQRTDTNIRFYSDDDLKLILNISLLKNHGIKISKIVGMSRDEIVQKVIDLENQNHNNDDQINALTVAMLDMDELLFNTVLSKNITANGFEYVMTSIITPFLKKIGLLWMSSSINPAQEHFMSNLIRQRLVAEIDKLGLPPKDSSLFMLFLPEGELHEISLLYSNLLLRQRGIKTIYLGQSVPKNDLEEVYHQLNPDCLLSVFTSQPNAESINSYVNDLGKKFSDASILLTGSQIINNYTSSPENVHILKDFGDLDLFLKTFSQRQIEK